MSLASAPGRLTAVLNLTGGVIAIDFRGHGRSGGRSTVGDREVLDVDAAARHARHLGYRRVGLIGFSMGGAVVVRHAGLLGGVDAVVSVVMRPLCPVPPTRRRPPVRAVDGDRCVRACARSGSRGRRGWQGDLRTQNGCVSHQFMVARTPPSERSSPPV